MTATSVLLILVGIFIIANAPNLVGVFQGNKSFQFQGATNTLTAGGAGAKKK